MTKAIYDSRLAGRAIGAISFFAFGAGWLEIYASQRFPGKPLAMIVVALIAAGLLLVALHRYRQLRSAAPDNRPRSASQRRARLIFHIVNAGQWLAIIIVCNVLLRFGLGVWMIPAVIMIVGLHLIPLGWSFVYRAHYLTGAALIVLAIAYPLLAAAGPASPLGCLGAGLILWSSALWALKASNAKGLPQAGQPA